MEDRKLTEKESLEVITSMIARTKERYLDDGNILLMWGYLAVFTAILVWVLLAITRQSAWNFLWFMMPLVGGVATRAMSRKQLRERGVRTFTDRATSELWAIAGSSPIWVAVVCLILQCLTGNDCWGAMLAYPLIVVPFAEIAQGILIKEDSLIMGGLTGLLIGILTICCIAGGIVLHANWFQPLFILAFVAMMIVPGHILNRKAKRE
ncbi:MAG: hypothetical protein K2H79_01505 [Bacteroidaceae bacterium]|nr:hypothetical protein [Bacteroidaceae bacterium]MDE7165716.1 hypothetical protein [Bacteroidaceae bacterium]